MRPVDMSPTPPILDPVAGVPEVPPQTAPRFAGTPHDAGEGTGFSDALALLRRRWRVVAIPTLAVLLASVAFVQLVTPRYTGEAKVLLESRDSAFTRPNQDRTEQPIPIDEQAVASQVQVAMSRDVAREAIRRLDLVGNAEFDPLVDGLGPVRRLMMMLGLAPNLLDRPPEERVLERYFDRLLVYPAGKSRILTIEFRSQDPDLAARGANVIAEVYLASLEAAKMDTARSASTWLGGNIDALRTRVSEAEAKVEAFRSRSGLFSGGGTVNLGIGAQQLTELSTQLSQARTLQADSAAKAKLIKSLIKDGRAFEIPDVANNELIRRLVEQRITLRAQLALEARTLLPGHPRIKELNAQLSDLEGQVRGAADRVVRTLENDATIAGSRVETLQAALDGQKSVVARSNGSEVELRALEREAKAQRDQLESYLARYREASARDAEKATPADARIVSRAVVPDLPSFPKKLPTVLFATLAALILSSGFVVGRHLLAEPAGERQADEAAEGAFEAPEPRPARPRRPVLAAVEGALAAVAVAVVPSAAAAEPAGLATPAPERGGLDLAPTYDLDGKRDLAATEDRYDLAALVERLRLRPAIGGGGRRILVAEALADFAPSLAGALARDGRTLLVALDGAASELGLTDLVAGAATFADVIAAVPGHAYHGMPRGSRPSRTLLDEPQAVEITLDALDRTYDWVVCRLVAPASAEGRELVAMTASAMDAVVIGSNSAADDPALVALYDGAVQAGAAEVVVAQDGVA